MQQTHTARQSKPRPDISIDSCEVVAHFASESNPTRKPYETVLNRYTGRCTCECRGFAAYRHCKHQEALCRLALIEGWLHKTKKGTRAPARAVVADPDPFTELFTASPVEVMA